MGKGRNEKNGCRIVNQQLYFYKSNKQFFLHILSNSLSGFFVVLRILLTKWSSYPDMQLSSQLLGLNENCFFFFLFSFFFFSFFFFSFYLLFLLKPSPIFFISSFLSPTGFSVPHKHLTATPSGSPTHPPSVTAATWIHLHDHFYSILNYFMISSPY